MPNAEHSFEPTVFSQAFPPINRPAAAGVSVVQVRIDTGAGTLLMDLNQLSYAAYLSATPTGGTIGASDISGLPAYRYTNIDVTMMLTSEELTRLIRYDLTPAEFITLRDKFGVFYEIHDDFYDEQTGESQQPMIETGTIDAETYHRLWPEGGLAVPGLAVTEPPARPRG